MKFGNLHFLWILWLVPAVLFFYTWAEGRKISLIRSFVSDELRDRLLEGYSQKKKKVKVGLILVAFILMALALIRPKWGFHWEEIKRRGVDIMIALDVSKSMLAEDVSPNRLERAKREILDLLKIIQGDRVGLIAFAGTSFVQAPLTLDYGAVHIFLEDVNTDLIPVPGTAIADAIEQGTKSFDETDKQSRVLILITDGEDHLGQPIEAAKNAAKEGVKIYTIGIGKEGGAPIPDKENGGFKKNRSGELVLTKFDEDMLQKIALESGGSYVRSVTGDLDLEKIYSDIRKSVEEKELQSGKRKRFEERYQWPLFLAFVFLFLEPLILEKRRSNKNKAPVFVWMEGIRGLRRKLTLKGFFGKSGAEVSPKKSPVFDDAKYTLIFFLLSIVQTGVSHAGLLNSVKHSGMADYRAKRYDEALKKLLDAQIEDPDNLHLKFNLADTYYKLGQYEEAEKLFQATANSADMSLTQKSFYNLGNTTFRSGKLQEAVAHYEQALKLKPDDQDAQYNLNFVRDEIKRRIEEQKKRQQNQGQDQKQGQNQNQDQNQDQGQNQQPDQPDKNQGQGQPPDAKQQQKDDDKNSQAGVGKKDEKQGDQKMSEEDAIRWLSTLKEHRNRPQTKPKQGSQGSPGQYQVEKDW